MLVMGCWWNVNCAVGEVCEDADADGNVRRSQTDQTPSSAPVAKRKSTLRHQDMTLMSEEETSTESWGRCFLERRSQILTVPSEEPEAKIVGCAGDH